MWTEVELTENEATHAPGVIALCDAAWAECGRSGPRPETWRPFQTGRGQALLLRRGQEPIGCAVVRPTPGMDTLEFIYARPDAGRSATCARLIDWACDRLSATGLTRIVYAAFAYWRPNDLPAELATAFRARRFGYVRGVYMGIDLTEPPGIPATPEGYAVVPFEDERLEEAAHMMLACPEPDAIYWDYGLCIRSITGAAAPSRPFFPHGLGQSVLDGNGRLVSFALSTLTGYVNHVYTLPTHRGRGLGSCALVRILRAIRERGIRRATILTHETNPGAIRLYEALGFRTQFIYDQYFLRR